MASPLGFRSMGIKHYTQAKSRIISSLIGNMILRINKLSMPGSKSIMAVDNSLETLEKPTGPFILIQCPRNSMSRDPNSEVGSSQNKYSHEA